MQNDFVKAYCWVFGSTKKQAEKVYNTADKSYIAAIVYAFERNAQAGFYHD